MRSHLTLIGMVIMKTSTNKCQKGYEEKETILDCCWECKLVQSLQKILWRGLRKLKRELPYDSAILLLGIHPDKAIFQKDTCTSMFTAAIFTMSKTWKQPKYSPTGEWIKKMSYKYTMKYYSATEKDKIMPLAAMWEQLVIIILSEVSQKRKYHMILLKGET